MSAHSHASGFEQEGARMIEATGRVFSVAATASLALVATAWLRGDVSLRTLLVVGGFVAFNIALAPIAGRFLGKRGTGVRLEVLRQAVCFFALCPAVVLLAEPEAAWWPPYMMFVIGAPVVTILAGSSTRRAFALVAAWTANLALAGFLAGGILGGYQWAYVLGTLLMTGVMSTEWAHMARTSLDREAERRAELQAEKERIAVLHQQLVDVSRRAGMEQVAVGILHNVGNVLNSANVSSEMIGKHANRLKASSLGNLVAFLQGTPGGIPAGELGKVIDYVDALSKSVAEQVEAIQLESAALQADLQSIRAVVQTQEALAAGPAVLKEKVKVEAQLNDALQLYGASFARHGIRLEREFAELSEVALDRQRFVQIVSSLIGNAKEALKEIPREDRRLKLRTRADERYLYVDVIDNGVGIAPSVRPKIFTFGYSTRKQGQGFGLHSAANTATEMGGGLTFESEGAGRGATFTLRLPRA